MDIKVDLDNKQWLQKWWVGWLMDLTLYDKVNEAYVFGGMGLSRLKYLGG